VYPPILHPHICVSLLCTNKQRGRRVRAPLPICAVPVCAPLHTSRVGECKRGGGALSGLHTSQRGAPPPGLHAAPGLLAPLYTKEGAPLPTPPFVCHPWGVVPCRPAFMSCLINKGGRGDKKRGGVPFPWHLCMQTGGERGGGAPPCVPPFMHKWEWRGGAAKGVGRVRLIPWSHGVHMSCLHIDCYKLDTLHFPYYVIHPLSYTC